MSLTDAFDMTYALNYYFRNIDNYSYHSEAQEKLSQQTKSKLLTAYQDSIGLPPDSMNTAKHVKTYLTERKNSLIDAGGNSFTETDDIKNMLESFSTLDACLKDIGGKYHPDDLNKYLQDERSKAINQIREQQTRDIAHLKTISTNPDAQAKQLSALMASQKTQLDTFEKSLNENIEALHKAAQHERDRISIFASLRQGNEEMRKAMDAAAFRKKTGSTDAVVGVSMESEGAALKDLSLDDIMLGDIRNSVKSLTGQDIAAQKQANGGYTFSTQYPNTLWSFNRYYSHRSNRSKTDALVMAHLLKLSGAENAVVRVDGFNQNPKIALKIARDLYEAAREAGYPLKDKTIGVFINGKSYTEAELFRDAPNRMMEMNTRVKNSAPVASTREQTEMMKQEMNAHRKQSKPKETQPSNAPATDAARPQIPT